MNFKHLRYFLVVAQEGSINRASEKLHLTPQTISGQIKLLRKNLTVFIVNSYFIYDLLDYTVTYRVCHDLSGSPLTGQGKRVVSKDVKVKIVKVVK